MKRVMILGGGFGGLAAANRLRERLDPQDEIILVDRRSHFSFGFRKTWALVGLGSMEVGQRPLASLARKGIDSIRGTVTRIDPQARSVEVDGRSMAADALVVALGTALAPEQVPGFNDYALNVYHPQEVQRNAAALGDFSGGRVMVGIFSIPYACPPAPFEIAMLVQAYFKGRGVRAEMEVFSPLPMSLPVLGEAGCEVIEGRLARQGIRFLAEHKAGAVEAGAVRFTSGPRPFDLLLGVPPHRPPQVAVEAGLAGADGWLEVDPRTMETRFPGVYALGDAVTIPMANGKPLPKAGVFAEAQGLVAAEHIAAALTGQESQATFSGEGGCYLEVGGGEAMLVQGQFLAEPGPRVDLKGPSAAYLEEKRRFETSRLEAWF